MSADRKLSDLDHLNDAVRLSEGPIKQLDFLDRQSDYLVMLWMRFQIQAAKCPLRIGLAQRSNCS